MAKHLLLIVCGQHNSSVEKFPYSRKCNAITLPGPFSYDKWHCCMDYRLIVWPFWTLTTRDKSSHETADYSTSGLSQPCSVLGLVSSPWVGIYARSTKITLHLDYEIFMNLQLGILQARLSYEKTTEVSSGLIRAFGNIEYLQRLHLCHSLDLEKFCKRHQRAMKRTRTLESNTPEFTCCSATQLPSESQSPHLRNRGYFPSSWPKSQWDKRQKVCQ